MNRLENEDPLPEEQDQKEYDSDSVSEEEFEKKAEVGK